jgi:hypothetical protein
MNCDFLFVVGAGDVDDVVGFILAWLRQGRASRMCLPPPLSENQLDDKNMVVDMTYKSMYL